MLWDLGGMRGVGRKEWGNPTTVGKGRYSEPQYKNEVMHEIFIIVIIFNNYCSAAALEHWLYTFSSWRMVRKVESICYNCEWRLCSTPYHWQLNLWWMKNPNPGRYKAVFVDRTTWLDASAIWVTLICRPLSFQRPLREAGPQGILPCTSVENSHSSGSHCDGENKTLAPGHRARATSRLLSLNSHRFIDRSRKGWTAGWAARRLPEPGFKPIPVDS